MAECTCDSGEDYASLYCDVHVACDDACKALQVPVTFDEIKAALIHWEHHRVYSGCSHGC